MEKSFRAFAFVYYLKLFMGHIKHIIPVMTASCILLCGCTAQRIETGSPEHFSQLAQDRAQVYDTEIPTEFALGFEEAQNIAIAQNLDARVAALEALGKEDDIDLARLQAMPQLSARRNYFGRSNEGASSSRSVITGNQSLEPSFSSDRYRTTDEISLNWDIIDIALAVAQSRIAKDETLIARERHQKVLQNISRDVTSAYWRAHAAQQSHKETKALLEKSKNYMADLGNASRQKLISATRAADFQRDLLQQTQTLRNLERELSTAEIELKSLLSIPQDTQLYLTSSPANYRGEIKTLLEKDINALEVQALHNRPEVTETIIQSNIDAQNTRNEILRTIPGANIFFGYNNDTNSFLQDSSWMSFSGTIAQNLTALFTAPTRIRTAENREDLGQARRISLVAAVLTQVHLSRHALQSALDEAQASRDALNVAEEQGRAARAQQSIGMGKSAETLPAIIEAQNARIQALKAEAQLLETHATFLNTLGLGYSAPEHEVRS